MLDLANNEFDEKMLVRECKRCNYYDSSNCKSSLFYNIVKGMKKKDGHLGCVLSSYFIETKNMKVNRKLKNE